MEQRLEGLDIARAFAILGMMLVNYALVFQIDFNGLGGQFISLFEGRAAAVFMILAGIGIGLMSKHKDLDFTRKQLARRAIFLWLLGLTLYGLFQWPADILHYYGAFMLLILPILRWRKEWLAVAIALCLIIQMILLLRLDYLAGWNIASLEYLDFWTLNGFLRNLLFNGFHPFFPWFAFMLYGLLLSRLPLAEVAIQKKMVAYGITIAVIVEIVSLIMLALWGHTETAMALWGTKPMPPNNFYMLAASGWATAWIGGINFLAQSIKQHPACLVTLREIGQLSMTHYVFHCAVVLTIADILGWIRPQSAAFVIVLSMVVFYGMGLFSKYWLRWHRRGPLELLMRRFSDGVK